MIRKEKNYNKISLQRTNMVIGQHASLVFVFLPSKKCTIWSFPMVAQINPLCLQYNSLSLCLEVQISAHTFPGIFKIPFFQDSPLAFLLAIARKKCEKMRKAADPSPALSSRCQQRRRLQTFRYSCQPPSLGVPQEFLRLY